MQEGNIQRPLLLNESMKDSIEQPQPINNPPRQESEVEPIRQQLVEHQPYQPPVNQPQQTNQYIPPIVNNAVHQQKPIQSQVATSVIQQPISQHILEYKTKGKKRYRVMQVCGLVCVLIGFVFIFAIPPFLQNFIKNAAIDQVIMSKDNQKLWGSFPGDSGTIIVRNFTFFRLLNEEDFLLRHQKPKFKQVSGFKLQQLQDFLDITYLDDGNKVKIRDYTRFWEWAESRNIDSPVNILNMGNIGYWSTLKNARPALILQQGLALLFTNMEQSIIPTLLSTGISSQFLPDKATAVNSLLTPAGVEPQNLQFLWNDPSYGMGNVDNLGEWAQAALDSFDNPTSSFQFSSSANKLKNYFVLTDGQLEYLMGKFYTYVVNLKHILVENHYCADIPLSQCTGRYLAIAQLTDGMVTAFPPPVSTISPNDTICDNNVTCKGYYPQLYAFEKNVFWKTVDRQKAKLLGLKSEITFTREQVLGWFDYNKTVTPGLDYNTAQNCLLHIGNLDQLWQWGTQYDQGMYTSMFKIRDRLKLQNSTQALVVWEWLKYLSKSFVTQNNKNDKLGVANLFTQGLFEQFASTEDNLGPLLLRKMIKNELKYKECHLFFQDTLQQPEASAKVSAICSNYTDIHTDNFTNFIISTCEEKYGPAWKKLRSFNISFMALEYHCQNNGQNNFGSLLHKVKVELNDQYKCTSTPKPYCSNFQLAVKQWGNSSITLNPPASIANVLPSSHSFHSWNPNVKPFEYGFFLNKFTAQERKVFPIFKIEQLTSLLSFDQWFSAPVVLRKIISGQIDEPFKKYVRWLSVSVTLNGYTTFRTVRQILFGYVDQFLEEVRTSYPPFGGDPSAPSLIALNELNLTKQNASQTIVFLTGKDDYRNVYQNYQINGYRYSVNNFTWFNGNKTQWAWKSPWAQNDYFYGTTAKIFAPNQFEADNLSLFIPQVQRYGSNFFHNETFKSQRFGVDLYMSFLSPYIGEVAPHNDIYYQTLPNVFNVSSIYGLPLYITKNHFMNCTQWLDLVDIYNEDLSIHYKNISHWDDTFILVQPYTGVSFQSVIYLQNNYYHQPDELYPYPIPTMLPIFSISRSGNLTEDKFHQLYDPLVMGLKAKSVFLILGIVITVVFALMLGLATYCLRKGALPERNQKMGSELGISLQERHENLLEPEQRLTLDVPE